MKCRASHHNNGTVATHVFKINKMYGDRVFVLCDECFEIVRYQYSVAELNSKEIMIFEIMES